VMDKENIRMRECNPESPAAMPDESLSLPTAVRVQ